MLQVRQQLSEQLSIGRNLTKKTENNETSDEEMEDNEMIPDLTLSQDPLNPWMLRRSDKSNVDADFNFGYKKYLKDKLNQEQVSESDSNDEGNNKIEISNTVIEDNSNIGSVQDVTMIKPLKHTKNKKNQPKIISTSCWTIEDVDSVHGTNTKTTEDVSEAFDCLETDIAKKVAKKIQQIRKNVEKIPKKNIVAASKTNDTDNIEYLKLRNQKKKAIIDEELNETTSKTLEEIEEQPLDILAKQPLNQDVTQDIDPTRFIQAKPKYLNTTVSLGENNLDELDDDEQVVPKVNIEDVFEEDDVVASFRQEKEDEINKNNSTDIDLSLPGWGSWGGKGVKKPSKRKRNRFILKGASKMPRRDDNKGDIIIKEYKDPKLSAHKLSEVPFPFTSVKEFEASIRTPLGNTFIPEKAHRKVIQPNIITKAGTIIEAMDEDELLVPRNFMYKNKSVIQLLAKGKNILTTKNVNK